MVPIKKMFIYSVYFGIVADPMPQFMTRIHSFSGSHFQLDNAQHYKLKIKKDWFLEEVKEFLVLNWPSLSQYLNSIGNIYDVKG